MLGAARTLHATLFLVVLCVTATQRIQHADFADVEATGLAPRRTGRCWVDGPCERYPDSGGRRDDNQQGYLLYSAGVSPELCALRARDHHRWCGNHPDAVVLTHFERETPLAPAVDVSDAAFPYIGLHSDAAAAAGSGEEGALQCVESYQIGEGSRWAERLCGPGDSGGGGTVGRARDPGTCGSQGGGSAVGQAWLSMHARSDVSVFSCSKRREAGEQAWQGNRTHAQYKLYVGDVSVQPSDEGGERLAGAAWVGNALCSMAEARGVFWQAAGGGGGGGVGGGGWWS